MELSHWHAGVVLGLGSGTWGPWGWPVVRVSCCVCVGGGGGGWMGGWQARACSPPVLRLRIPQPKSDRWAITSCPTIRPVNLQKAKCDVEGVWGGGGSCGGGLCNGVCGEKKSESPAGAARLESHGGPPCLRAWGLYIADGQGIGVPFGCKARGLMGFTERLWSAAGLSGAMA